MSRWSVLFILLIPFFAQAKQIDVCTSCDISTIKQAVAEADTGDVIILQSGVYTEAGIILNKPISLIGKENVIIDGDNQGEILGIHADHVSISGLTIRNVGVSFTKDHAAIRLYKVKDFLIEDNTFERVFFGILCEKSNHGTIKGNRVTSDGTEEISSGNGIHLWHCNNVLIENNHVSNLRDGIYFEFVSESTVINNLSENNFRYGLHFMFSNNDVYTDNVFRENGAGVAVMFSKFIKMERNTFFKNWGSASYGLLLKEIYDAEIINNVFEENTIGINAEGSTRINYIRNSFKGNGWAIKIAGACYANVFEQNNFMSNAFDVSYNSKMNDNRFVGNYWSDYTGYDLDKDGVGDVPYRPVKLFSYIVNRTPETIVLLRSLFVDIINFSEKVSPVFTPDELVDETPFMKMIP